VLDIAVRAPIPFPTRGRSQCLGTITDRGITVALNHEIVRALGMLGRLLRGHRYGSGAQRVRRCTGNNPAFESRRTASHGLGEAIARNVAVVKRAAKPRSDVPARSLTSETIASRALAGPIWQ
jgi:hypothetical protein